MDGGSAIRIGLCCAAAAAGGMLFASACGDGPGVGPPQDHALQQAVCQKLVECGCGDTLRPFGLQVPLTCEGWTLESLFGYDPYGYRGYGYEEGQTYEEPEIQLDEDCLERLADALASAECDGLPIPLACEDRCSLYFGPQLEGYPCTRPHECSRGLVCFLGECRDPCTVHPAAEGERCDDVGCEPGLVCGVTLQFEYPTCTRLPGPGSPCDLEDCAAGAWCDDSVEPALCVAAAPTGAPCMGHAECQSYYCPAGTCAERPGPGSPCDGENPCRSGSVCASDENGGTATCVAAPPLCQYLTANIIGG